MPKAPRGDRSRWVVGVAGSHAEMADIDEAWWLALSVPDRIALVTELSEQADWSQDDEQGSAPISSWPGTGARGLGRGAFADVEAEERLVVESGVSHADGRPSARPGASISAARYPEGPS